ncbi:hypothetical protein VA599_13350 [Chromobacterium sp. TRC.1.1.SA]|uniref:Uncharacterized protein n=1 Tax=Chromobacterium indicum TaxID=3110228 RepID=A0ABV0CKR0_9NEIS
MSRNFQFKFSIRGCVIELSFPVDIGAALAFALRVRAVVAAVLIFWPW